MDGVDGMDVMDFSGPGDAGIVVVGRARGRRRHGGWLLGAVWRGGLFCRMGEGPGRLPFRGRCPTRPAFRSLGRGLPLDLFHPGIPFGIAMTSLWKLAGSVQIWYFPEHGGCPRGIRRVAEFFGPLRHFHHGRDPGLGVPPGFCVASPRRNPSEFAPSPVPTARTGSSGGWRAGACGAVGPRPGRCGQGAELGGGLFVQVRPLADRMAL